MLQPSKSLNKCKELIPELKLDMGFDDNMLVVKPIKIEEWKDLFFRFFHDFLTLQSVFKDIPDVEPYNSIEEHIDNMGAIVHSLFIFYDCMINNEQD